MWYEAQPPTITGTGQLRDEALQVERLGDRGDVLGRDDRALDHQDVEAGLDGDVDVVGHPLRRQRARDRDALRLDLLDPLGDQLGLDRLPVDLLEAPGGLGGRHRRDALQLGVGLLVAGLDALEVEDRQAADLADDPRRAGVDHAVHRRRQERQLERVPVELPREIDVLGIARPPARHDRDLVQPVRPPPLLAPPDLDLHSAPPATSARTALRTKKPRPGAAAGPGSVTSCWMSIGAHENDRGILASGSAARLLPACIARRDPRRQSSATTSTRRISDSTSDGSNTPAPKRWVLAAPQATARASAASGGWWP